jgi:glycosyltransferase involved in cell wall biosynthesis
LKMRIALFHNLPSGGAKRALFEWIYRMVDEHTIDVYSLTSANHEFCDIRPFVSQHHIFEFGPRQRFESPLGRLDQYQRWRDLGDLERLNRRIARQIDAGGYDVLFVNPCMYTYIPSLVQYTEIPTVYYLHEPFGPSSLRRFERPYIPKDNWRKVVDRFDPLIWLYQSTLGSVQKRGVQLTKRLLANSEYTRELIRSDFGVDSEFSPIGVDINGFRPMVDVVRENMVVSVGEMSPRKGFNFIIESLGEIPVNQRPALKLACNMFKRNELRYIKELAERNCVNLEILMNLNVDELRLLYNRARLCVYSPVKEPFGLVPLEAMACGTPVVGVKEGGIPESVVHEHTGLLVARDAQQFGTAIQYLLENPELAAAYGQNGREHVVKNWTWDRSVSILTAHLVECAGLSN